MIEFPCQNCGVYLKVQYENAGKTSRCPKCNSMTPIPVPIQKHIPARAGKTGGERLIDALKMFGVILLICFIFMGLLAPIGMILMVAGVLFFLFFGSGYVITTIGTDWWHRNDPHYQEYRKAGGQPYLDNMGLTSPSQDWKLPYPEREYSGFVPPRSWAFQCLNCFARVESDRDICWSCGVQLTARKKRFPLD